MNEEQFEKESNYINVLIDELERRVTEKQDSLSIVSAVNDVMELLEIEREKWRQFFIAAFEKDYDQKNADEIAASIAIADLDALEISLRLFRATHLTNVKHQQNGL